MTSWTTTGQSRRRKEGCTTNVGGRRERNEKGRKRSTGGWLCILKKRSLETLRKEGRMRRSAIRRWRKEMDAWMAAPGIRNEEGRKQRRRRMLPQLGLAS